jgi:hypothetical protein
MLVAIHSVSIIPSTGTLQSVIDFRYNEEVHTIPVVDQLKNYDCIYLEPLSVAQIKNALQKFVFEKAGCSLEQANIKIHHVSVLVTKRSIQILFEFENNGVKETSHLVDDLANYDPSYCMPHDTAQFSVAVENAIKIKIEELKQNAE